MALLINPFLRTVSNWTPSGAFLSSLRTSLDCSQVDSIMIQQGVCLWVDNFGLLRPDQAFFRFQSAPMRFAGKAIMTGVDHDGMPMDLQGPTAEQIMAQLDWCEGLQVVAIREELQVTPTDLGPWPRVIRMTEFNQPVSRPTRPFDASPASVAPEAPDRPGRAGNGASRPHPAPVEVVPETPTETVQPLCRWAVTSDDESDTYRAVEIDDASGRETGRELTFKSMPEVTAFFRSIDAARHPVPADAPDDLVGIFMAPMLTE